MTKDLLGKFVKFRTGRKLHYGRVLSIEQGVANIRGIEQKNTGRAAYHYPISEIVECSHDEVYKIGRGIIQMFK